MSSVEFTLQEIKDYLQRAVHSATGDDMERARSTFNWLSAADMDKPYYGSDRTPRQILDGYIRERALATAAVRWVLESPKEGQSR